MSIEKELKETRDKIDNLNTSLADKVSAICSVTNKGKTLHLAFQRKDSTWRNTNPWKRNSQNATTRLRIPATGTNSEEFATCCIRGISASNGQDSKWKRALVASVFTKQGQHWRWCVDTWQLWIELRIKRAQGINRRDNTRWRQSTCCEPRLPATHSYKSSSANDGSAAGGCALRIVRRAQTKVCQLRTHVFKAWRASTRIWTRNKIERKPATRDGFSLSVPPARARKRLKYDATRSSRSVKATRGRVANKGRSHE